MAVARSFDDILDDLRAVMREAHLSPTYLRGFSEYFYPDYDTDEWLHRRFDDLLREAYALDPEQASSKLCQPLAELARSSPGFLRLRRITSEPDEVPWLEQLPELVALVSSDWDTLIDNVERYPKAAHALSLSLTKIAEQRKFVELGAVAQLMQLNLGGTRLRKANAEVMTRSKLFPTVEFLGLGQCQLREDGLKLMLDNPELGPLRGLDLGYNNLFTKGLEALARSPVVDGLEYLSVVNCKLSSIRPLTSSTRLSSLRYLDISLNDIECFDELAASKTLTGLEHLDARQTRGRGRVNHPGRFLRSDNAAQLRHLHLYYVDDAALEAFAACPGLPSLKRLSLEGTGLTDAHAQVLAEMPLDALRVLDLHHCELSDRGVVALAQASWFGGLQQLNLSGNAGVTDASLEAIVEAPWSEGWRQLELASTQVGSEGFARLVGSERAATLAHIDVQSTRLTKKGFEALLDATHIEGLRSVYASVKLSASKRSSSPHLHDTYF